MKRTIKQVLSLIMAIVIMLGSMPLSIIAETTGNESLITQNSESELVDEEDDTDDTGNDSNQGDNGSDQIDDSEQTVVAESLRLNLQIRGGTNYYEPHGYASRHCLMFNYGVRYTLGTYNLADYEKLEIKYATDGAFIAQQEGMAQPAFFALCKDNKEIGIDGVGYADKQILHGDKILAKADCEDAYTTNFDGINWDRNERTTTIDLSEVDYNGEVTLFHFNSTGNSALVVEIVLYANGDDTVQDETDIVLPEPNKPAEPSREVDFYFENEDITHISYDKINEIYVVNHPEFKEKAFLLSGEKVATFSGWIGSKEEVSGFSFSINNGPKQLNTGFLAEAEQAVIDAAIKTGATYAYRFNVVMPVEEGSQLVKIFAEFENGEYEIIWILELTIGKSTAYDPGENIYIKETPIRDFRYTITDGQVTIDKYLCNDKRVIIPTEIEGYPVTSIGYRAFEYCSSLESVIIPEGLKNIGFNAFSYCSSLKSIAIPESVESIGSVAFSNCSSLTSITIPKGITSIGFYAFSNCSSLTSVTILEGVTSIGEAMFFGCSSLERITISDSVTNINYYAFWNCSNLNHIYYTGTKTEWENIIISRYNECFINAIVHCEVVPGNEITVIEKEATCTIGTHTLCKCTYCDFVVYVEDEEENSLGHNYEEGICTLCGLSEDFPLSYEFKKGKIEITDCKEDVIGIVIPDTIEGYTVTSIGESAFAYCSSLRNITIPSGVSKINYDAFWYCIELGHVYYTGTKTEWNKITIDGYNEDLTDAIIHYEVVPGNEITVIEKEATCTIGTHTIYECTYCDFIVDIDEEENSLGHNYEEGICTLCGLSENFPLSYEFKKGKIEITDCNDKAKIVDIPDTIEGYPVISIGEYAFYKCDSLTRVIIPEGVTGIDRSAFAHCSLLTNITIPRSVSKINYDAFWECGELNHVYYTGTETEWNEITIDGYNEDLTDAIIHYEVVPGSEIALIEKEATCTIGTHILYKCSYCDFIVDVDEEENSLGHNYEEGICTLCGLSEDFPLSYEFKKGKIEITDCKEDVIGIVIPDTIEGYTVTSIGKSAFEYCSSLRNITIPSGVINIGSWAFADCSSLSNITIPSGVINIGKSAFSKCYSLKSIVVSEDNINYSAEDGVLFDKDKTKLICCPAGKQGEYIVPDTVKKICEEAFYYCSLLTKIIISDGVTSIGNSAFAYCSSLRNITISSGVTSIGNSAFAYCSSLRNITIPSGATSLGNWAFAYCSSLRNITIPSGVTSLGNWAFYCCSSLRNITIPSSVSRIYYNAFLDCGELNHVYYTGTETEWNEITIDSYNGDLTDAIIHYEVVPGSEMALIEKEATCTIGTHILYKCSYCDFIVDVDEEKNSLGHNYEEEICTLCGLSEDFPLSYEFKKGKIEITDCKEDVISVVIPDTIEGYPVTSIGEYAFYYCSSLVDITISSNVTSLEYSAFSGCSSLVSITIPSSVINIGEFVFSNCSSLTSFIVSEDNTYYSAEDGVLFNKDKTKLICCPIGKNGEYIVPNTVVKIGDKAFSGCSLLTKITISNGVTDIGASAFERCYSLTKITIPSSVISIDYSAFWGCSKLNHVYYTGTETEWNEITIDGYNEDLSDAIIHYEVIPGSEITMVDNEATCTIGTNTIYKCNYCDFIVDVDEEENSLGHNYEEGLCKLCGLSEDFPLSYELKKEGIEITDCKDNAKIVVIPHTIEGYPVTSIGNSAFYYCRSLTNITIPSGVTSIGSWAFLDCPSLKNIYYSGSEIKWNEINIADYGNDDLLDATIYFDCLPGAAIDIGTDFVAQIITDNNKQALGFSGVNGALVQFDENNRGQMFYFVRQKDGSYKIINAKTSCVLGLQDVPVVGTGINIMPQGLADFSWIVQYESGKIVLKAVGTENLFLGYSGAKVQLVEFTADDLSTVFTVNTLGRADYEVPTKSENGDLSDAEISIINNSLCEVSDDCKNMNESEINQKISEYASKSFDLGVNETKAIALCVNILFAGGEAELERVLAKTNDYSIDGIYAALLTDTGTQVGMYRVRNWEFYKSCVTAGI